MTDQIVFKIQSIIDRIINAGVILAAIAMITIGLYAIFDVDRMTKDAIIPSSLKDDHSIDGRISIDELQKINSEIIGWIEIDNTNVDYPLLKAADNNKYLTRSYKDEYTATGGIFVDYRNDDLNDDYTIIYGHRTTGDLMFSDVAKYYNADFFNNHKTGKLTTSDAIYDLEVIAYAKIELNTTNFYDVRGLRVNNNQKVLGNYKNIATLGNIDVEDKSRIILLSTCDKDSKHYRDTILVKVK